MKKTIAYPLIAMAIFAAFNMWLPAAIASTIALVQVLRTKSAADEADDNE